MRYLFLSVTALCGLSKAEDIPLGTYVGSYGDDGSGYSKVVMTVKPGLVADFKFDSNWSGYGSAEPLTGECLNTPYLVSMRNPPHFTFHLGPQDACIQGLVDKWNAQTQASHFLGAPFNFWYTHGEDRMDTGESLGYNIIIVRQPVAVDIEEIAVRFDALMSNIAAEIRDANEQVSSDASAEDNGVAESKQDDDQENEENSASDEDDQDEEHGAHYLNAVMQLNEDLEDQDEQNWDQLVERDEGTNEWRGFVGYEGDDYEMDQLNTLIQQEEDEQDSFGSGHSEDGEGDQEEGFDAPENSASNSDQGDNEEEQSDDVNDNDDDDAPEYQESESNQETTVAPENVGAE